MSAAPIFLAGKTGSEMLIVLHWFQPSRRPLMRYVSALALLFALAWLHATGQQNVEALQTAEAGPTVPVLLPSATTVSTPKHCDELNGFVKFAATIDTAGLPHELKMLEASDRRLVGFATEIAEAQRFKPAPSRKTLASPPFGLTPATTLKARPFITASSTTRVSFPIITTPDTF